MYNRVMTAVMMVIVIVACFIGVHILNLYSKKSGATIQTGQGMSVSKAGGAVPTAAPATTENSVAATSTSPQASSVPVSSATAQPLPKSGPIISINFDDGFESAYTLALPLLDKAGYKATWYIITGPTALNSRGYMTTAQVLALQTDGQEIGAHTRTHPSLGTFTDANQISAEVLGSKQDLLAMGIKDVSTFAYPEGSFSPLAEEVVKESGFAGARITRPLLNNNTVDPYLLKYQRVQYDTTWADVKSAIDQAIAKKEWVILVFHRIDEDGNEQSARHEILEQAINYLKQTNVPVVTTEQGLKILPNIK